LQDKAGGIYPSVVILPKDPYHPLPQNFKRMDSKGLFYFQEKTIFSNGLFNGKKKAVVNILLIKYASAILYIGVGVF
jgi:hypothetical protein